MCKQQLILTKHVIERRKKGFIPQDKLQLILKYFVFNYLKMRKKGVYKITTKESTAIIIKNRDNKYIFITFFGYTSWLIDINSIEQLPFKIWNVEYLGTEEEQRINQKLKYDKEQKRTQNRTKKMKPRKLDIFEIITNLKENFKSMIVNNNFDFIKLDPKELEVLVLKFGIKKPIYKLSNNEYSNDLFIFDAKGLFIKKVNLLTLNKFM